MDCGFCVEGGGLFRFVSDTFRLEVRGAWSLDGIVLLVVAGNGVGGGFCFRGDRLGGIKFAGGGGCFVGVRGDGWLVESLVGEAIRME